MSVKMSYTFCLLKRDLILTCLDFGVFDLDNLVWGQLLTEREKPTDSPRQHSTFPKLQTCVLHQQFISHWIFPALLLFCTIKLTCQLWGCQPQAGLPPCLSPAVHPLPSPIPPIEKHCLLVSTLSRAIKTALLLWCLYFTALWSRCSLETMVLYPGKLWWLFLLCCISWTNLLWGCRGRQKEQAKLMLLF